MKYKQPFNETNENAVYKDFNLETGEAGSIPPAAAIEHPMREIMNVITGAGLTPSETDLTQLKQAIDALIAPKANTTDVNAALAGKADKKLPLVSIITTSGSVSLLTNTIYAISLNGITTFVLPQTVDATVHNQIKMFMRITGAISINWGTSNFINATAPDVAAGDYLVYWDYNPNKAAWTCGAMIDGAV